MTQPTLGAVWSASYRQPRKAVNVYQNSSTSGRPSEQNQDVVDLLSSSSDEEQPDVVQRSLQAPARRAGHVIPEPLIFEQDYHYFQTSSVETQRWHTSDSVVFSVFAEALSALEATRSRLAKERILVNLFRLLMRSSPEDLVSAVRLITNYLVPPWYGTPTGVGGSTVAKAVLAATGLSRKALHEQYSVHGDLGTIAASCKKYQALLVAHRPLTIYEVFACIKRLGTTSGSGSGKARQQACIGLLRRCAAGEIKYVTRALLYHLRVGATEVTALQCMARAAVLHHSQRGRGTGGQSSAETRSASSGADLYSASSGAGRSLVDSHSSRDGGSMAESSGRRAGSASEPPHSQLSASDVAELETAMQAAANATRKLFGKRPSIEVVAGVLQADGPDGLEEAGTCQLWTPVQPMLAAVARSFDEVAAKQANCTVSAELKYDGQRIQVHCCTTRAKDALAHLASLASSGGPWPPSLSVSMQHVSDPHGNPTSGSLALVSLEGLGGAPVLYVRCFSRNLEDTTRRWPQVAGSLARSVLRLNMPAAAWTSGFELPSRFIVDGEIVAVSLANDSATKKPGSLTAVSLTGASGVSSTTNPADRFTFDTAEMLTDNLTRTLDCYYRILPFQSLSRRPNPSGKSQAAASSAAPYLASVAKTLLILYDMVMLDGVDMAECSLSTRREALCEKLPDISGELEPSKRVILSTSDATFREQISAAVQASVQHGCEGIMSKVVRLPTAYPAANEPHGSPTLKSHRKRPRSSGTQAHATRGQPLSVHYECRRSDSWIKLKKDYLSPEASGLAGIGGLGDSFDLVPIGGWLGNGRKAGWLSPILMATVNKATGEYYSMCRVMSGITDDLYKRLTAWYLEPGKGRYFGDEATSGDSDDDMNASGNQCQAMMDMELPDKLPSTLLPVHPRPAMYVTRESPSVWFKPLQVWEVRGADLTASAVHMAAAGQVGHGGRGVSLRFPRLIRTRPDKGVGDCTPPESIAAAFLAQAGREHAGQSSGGASSGRGAATGVTIDDSATNPHGSSETGKRRRIDKGSASSGEAEAEGCARQSSYYAEGVKEMPGAASGSGQGDGSESGFT